MKIVIDNRRRETYSDRLSIVGDNRPITKYKHTKVCTVKEKNHSWGRDIHR
jgi:hypothetical protein